MIIGLTGLKQSGKSTAAKYLESKYGFKRHNFKDALVKELKRNFPDLLEEMVSVHDAENIDKLFEEKPPLIRKLLQNYGTEVRRREDSEYWIREWINNRPLSNTVVDDVRFLNEAQAVRLYGGRIVQIIKQGQESNDQHQSETEMARIIPDSKIIANEGKPEDIEKAIDLLMEGYYGIIQS